MFFLRPVHLQQLREVFDRSLSDLEKMVKLGCGIIDEKHLICSE